MIFDIFELISKDNPYLTPSNKEDSIDQSKKISQTK